MPVTRGVGGGIQLLDLGGVINSANQLAQLKLNQQRLRQAGQPDSLAERKFQLQERALDLREGGLENEAAKATIDIAIRRTVLMNKGRLALRNGDQATANDVAITLFGEGSFIARDPDAPMGKIGQWKMFAASQDREFTLNVWDDVTNDPRLVARDRARMALINRKEAAISRADKKFAILQSEKLSETIVNPSSRRRIGRVTLNIDRSDALRALLTVKDKTTGKMIEIPDNIDFLSKEKRQELIRAWNQLPPQFVQEVVVGLDSLIRQGAPTEGGVAHLRPNTLLGKANEFVNQIKNNPGGADLGAFVLKFTETILRERELNAAKRREAIRQIAAPFLWMVDEGGFAQKQFERVMRSFANEVVGGRPSTFPTDLNIEDSALGDTVRETNASQDRNSQPVQGLSAKSSESRETARQSKEEVDLLEQEVMTELFDLDFEDLEF